MRGQMPGEDLRESACPAQRCEQINDADAADDRVVQGVAGPFDSLTFGDENDVRRTLAGGKGRDVRRENDVDIAGVDPGLDLVANRRVIIVDAGVIGQVMTACQNQVGQFATRPIIMEDGGVRDAEHGYVEGAGRPGQRANQGIERMIEMAHCAAISKRGNSTSSSKWI